MVKTFSFPDINTPSDIAWFNQQMADSGIAQNLIDLAGFKLQPGRYLIPYFRIDGHPAGITKARLRPPEGQVDSHGYKVEAPETRRYITVEGVGRPAQAYWPRFPDWQHSTRLYQHLQHSLWITEGEKKAICLQSALAAQGISGSAVGMGGVAHTKGLIEELTPVNMWQDAAKRDVFICMDWNDPQQAAKKAETLLYKHFKERGADVTILRWPIDEGDGEQKIDDAIVKHGLQIANAITYSREHEIIPTNEADDAMAWFNERFAKCGGKVLDLKTAKGISYNAFAIQYSHKYHTEISEKGTIAKVRHVQIWLEREETPILDGLTFQPWGCMEAGRAAPDIIDNHLNLFSGWPEAPTQGDVSLLHKHMAHCFPNAKERRWFECWVAHMVQRPEEQPSTYVNLTSLRQGTGKSLTVEILARMLGRRYCARGDRTSWLGTFNGAWTGALLVATDEAQATSTREMSKMGERIKSIVGAPTVVIERKGQDQHTVPNCLRLIFTGNESALAAINQADRRAAYFDVPKVMPQALAQKLVAWLKMPGTTGALLHYFGTLDLTGWDPQAPAIRTEAAENAIEASTNDLDLFMQDVRDGILLSSRDIWQSNEIYLAYEHTYGSYFGSKSGLMGRLKRAGVTKGLPKHSGVFKMDGQSVRLWCVRDHAKWCSKTMNTTLWVSEAQRQ